MVSWFIVKQSRTKTIVTISIADPPTVLLKNSSMVQTRTETVITVSCADPPTILLENGSMVHNQTNTDRLWKLSATFLENVWLARPTM